MEQSPAPPYPGLTAAPHGAAGRGRRGALRWALGTLAVSSALLTGLLTRLQAS